MPKVINLKNRKLHVVYSDEVYIGRGVRANGWDLEPSKWFNPFQVGKDGDENDVLEKYENYVRSSPKLMACLHELKHKNLCCWCYPKPTCHAFALLKIMDERDGSVIEPPE